MKLSEGQFAGLHDKLGTDGGFTVHPSTGDPHTTGISVAPRDNERKVSAADSSPVALSDYHADSGNQERFGRGAAFGGWRGPDGSDCLDTPTVQPNTPGGNARARKQTVLSHQVASYDIDAEQENFNPYHPEGREALGYEPHEIAAGASPKKGDSPEKARSRSEWALSQPEVQAHVEHPRAGAR